MDFSIRDVVKLMNDQQFPVKRGTVSLPLGRPERSGLNHQNENTVLVIQQAAFNDALIKQPLLIIGVT